MPARQPSSPASSASSSLDGDTTLEATSVFVRFRNALPKAPFVDVTLHDGAGELLWRDRPDSGVPLEQVLRDALDALVLGIRYPYLELAIEGGRTGVVLPAWAPDGSLAAVGTLILDTATLDRSIDSCASFVTPEVRAALKAIASSLSGLEWPAAPPPAPEPQADWKLEPPAAGTPSAAAPHAPRPPPAPPAPPRASVAATPAPAAAPDNSAEVDRLVAAIRDEALELHVQPLARLRSSARTRRYEVLLRSRAEGDAVAPQALLRGARAHGLDSMLDRRVISQLIAWLVRNRAMWKGEVPMFSVNLSPMAVTEAHFFKFIDLCVRKAALPAGIIGFEIGEQTCRDKPECVQLAIETFNGLSCPVVIDDFTGHSDVLPLLMKPGVKLVKMDAQLTTGALGDRLREAKVVALVQAMRVLGMQTVAKRVEDEGEREWLTALGVDFVQSFRFMPPEPLSEWEKKK